MRDKGKMIFAVAGGAAIAFGIWAPLASRERPPTLDMISHILVGVAFIAAAYVVRARRPESRIALLLFAVGVTWYVNDLTFIHHEIPFTLALLFAPITNAFLLHTFVAFPSGQLRRGFDRSFVIAAYAWIFLQSLLANIFLNTQAQACGCPRNLLLIHSSSHANDVISSIGGYAVFFLALGTVWIVRNHMRNATPPGKRALAPVAWIAGPVALVALARYIADAANAPIGVFHPLWIAWNFSYCLLPVAIVIGLVRARLGRLAVSDLVVRLSKPLAPGEFEDALADTLGDPSLEILYWLPKDGIYVDADGARQELPKDDASAVTVVERNGETIGALVYDPALREEPDLVQGVVAAAQLALDNERLHAEVRAQLEEVRASRARIVEAADKARKKVERDLHDGAQQRLVGLSIALSMAEQRAKSDPRLQEMLFGASADLRQAIAELRELARGMYPAILADAGLEQAVVSLAGRSPIPVDVTCDISGRFPEPIEMTAYYVVAEALTNVAKYARASQAAVRIARANGTLLVEVSDNGIGGADAAKGSGLHGLADRLGAVNGRIRVESPAGAGTRLVAEIPVD